MNFPNYKNMEFTSALSGSTGADLFKNKSDKKWVIKKSKKGAGGYAQVKNEAIVDDIYQALGIPVPKHKLDEDNKALILEYIDGKLLQNATQSEFEKAIKELQNGFVIDALLANWDVIGLDYDNIILPSDGTSAVRIDNGGALTFRASGGKKEFGNITTEIDSMRKYSISPQSHSVFGDLTDADINEQIKTLVAPNYELILSLTPDDIKPNMKARMDHLIEGTVWMNSTKFKNTVKEVKKAEYTSKVQSALVKIFKGGWMKYFKNTNSKNTNSNITNNKTNNIKNNEHNESDKQVIEFINKVLKEHKAYISGGFILKAIGAFVDDKSVDIDIYVPTEYADDFRNIMTKLFESEAVIKHIATNSPTSFFKKNGIKSVSKYSRNKPKYAEMDIVEVALSRNPIDVIKNFDFTFCENWYDGENIYMVHPDHVKSKHGFLENNYLKLLFDGNPILINRIKKYIGRGFKFNINNPVTKKVEDITSDVMEGTKFKQIAPVIKLNSYVTANMNRNNANASTNIHPIINSSMPLDEIEDHIIPQPLRNIGRNISMNSTVHLNTNDHPLDVTILTKVDKAVIQYYTGSGSSILNKFLYADKLPNPDNTVNLIKWIRNKFPIQSGESSESYNKRVIYYYCVNLYNTIQKSPQIVTTPYRLYRGAKTWYLIPDKYRMYYLNGFSSTSASFDVAKQFGTVYDSSKNMRVNNIYTFYVHPLCRCMNVSSLSKYKHEKEVLISPYNRYYYIGGIVYDETTTIKKVAVLPTDLDIPTTYGSFMEWNKGIAERAVYINDDDAPLEHEGGRVLHSGIRVREIMQNNPFFNMNATASNAVMPTMKRISNTAVTNKLIRNRTNKKLKSPGYNKVNIKTVVPKMNTTRRVNKNMNISSNNEVSAITANKLNRDKVYRFSSPMQSFPGKAPTASEMNAINQMIQFFEKEDNYKK